MAETEIVDVREQFKAEDGSYRIEPDMIISDVIGAFPKVASVFMTYGLHCVGCAANSFDTVEGGAKLHGMPEEEIRQMITDANDAINRKIDTVDVTENALAKIKEIRAEEDGKTDWPLRVRVASDCCQGFKYDMDFDQPNDDDVRVEFDGLTVIVDPESMPLLKGSSIDFVDGFMGSGFKIDNPNKRQGCRCKSEHA